MRKTVLTSLLAACLLATPAALAQTPAPTAQAERLTTKQSAEIVDAAIRAMDGYFDQSRIAPVKAKLKSERSKLIKLTDRAALSDAISAITLSTSNDLHLKTSVETVSIQSAGLSPAEEKLLDARLAHGFQAARRLPGNIGYLKLRLFEDSADAVAMIDAAMAMLKDTDALILDMRENTGGGGASDERLLGHLSRDPLPLATIHWRMPDGSEQTETRQVSVPATGPLYPDKPIYVLTAKRTFSAAESFVYTLQVTKRATLIGETTRGGGNPGRGVSLGYGVGLFVPNGWVTHPLTGKSWDGVGVTPDVATPPAEALTEAYRRALDVAKPTVSTPKSEAEIKAARADPKGALIADQQL